MMEASTQAAIKRIDNHWRRLKSLFMQQALGTVLIAFWEYFQLPVKGAFIFGAATGMLILCVNVIGLAICERDAHVR